MEVYFLGFQESHQKARSAPTMDFCWHWFDSSGLCDLCPVHSSRQCVASEGGDMDEKWGTLLENICQGFLRDNHFLSFEINKKFKL